jgi:hypothetical protein
LEDEYLDPPSDLRPDWLDEIDYEPPAITKLKTLVLERYHDYLDVFSKEKGESLPSHKDHDLRINLVEGSTPPFSGIYCLANPESLILKQYIDDMMDKGSCKSHHHLVHHLSFSYPNLAVNFDYASTTENSMPCW